MPLGGNGVSTTGCVLEPYPVLVETNKHCVEASSKRISFDNNGYTVASCNTLCHNTASCV